MEPPASAVVVPSETSMAEMELGNRYAMATAEGLAVENATAAMANTATAKRRSAEVAAAAMENAATAKGHSAEIAAAMENTATAKGHSVEVAATAMENTAAVSIFSVKMELSWVGRR